MNYKQVFFAIDYRGNLPLWKVFWGYGVIFSQLYFWLILFMYNRVGSIAIVMLLSGFMVYTLGIMRLVWINALNTNRDIYTFSARYLTVVWMINSILVSLYLFMTYFGYWKLLVALP